MKLQVEVWAHGVRFLGKISKRHPQSDYAGLGILLQLKWKYLQSTAPRVGTRIGPIKESLRDTLFPGIFGGGEIFTDFRKILGHSVNCGGLGIPYPQLLAESEYNTSKASRGGPVGSLLGGTVLKYVGYTTCVYRDISGARKELQHV